MYPVPDRMLYAQFDESNSDCEEKQRAGAPRKDVCNNRYATVTLDTGSGTPGPDRCLSGQTSDASGEVKRPPLN